LIILPGFNYPGFPAVHEVRQTFFALFNYFAGSGQSPNTGGPNTSYYDATNGDVGDLRHLRIVMGVTPE
jgi:hypothetical protein